MAATTEIAPPCLACTGVTVRFGGLVAVRDASLSVPPATIVGLVGPNGAGKSTLFGVLSGLIRPSEGAVFMNGDEVTTARPQVRSARGLARTFQRPELFAGLTVREHLVIAHRAKHARRRLWSDLITMGSLRAAGDEESGLVDELIERLGLSAVADRAALGMPAGLARSLELGRALANDPSVLLLDEPSAGLNSAETEQFERTLRWIADERRIAILLVEHDVEMVMRLSSAVTVLDFGQVIARGTAAEVTADPAVRAAYLGEEAQPAQTGQPPGGSAELLGDAQLAQRPAQGAGPGPQPPILAVDGLQLSYGDVPALNGISFQVEAGRACAVLGANGAGKSSLARAISGLVPPTAGHVLLGGEETTSWPPHRIRRAGLVHLPEGRGVFRSLTVMENLRMATAPLESRQARRQGVDLALEVFRPLAQRRGHAAGLLSGGEQQMLSLARAIATSPRLIVADEMSLGLAPKLVDLVFEALERARQAGIAVILIEQYVHRALAFADACLVLQRGSVAWSGPAAEARSEVLARYLGDSMTAMS